MNYNSSTPESIIDIDYIPLPWIWSLYAYTLLYTYCTSQELWQFGTGRGGDVEHRRRL